MANGKWNKEIATASQEGSHNFIACFTDREKVKRVLEKLKEEELSISILNGVSASSWMPRRYVEITTKGTVGRG
jgi:hypothetical protein